MERYLHSDKSSCFRTISLENATGYSNILYGVSSLSGYEKEQLCYALNRAPAFSDAKVISASTHGNMIILEMSCHDDSNFLTDSLYRGMNVVLDELEEIMLKTYQRCSDNIEVDITLVHYFYSEVPN